MADGDRIIANLPPLFGALPRPTVLAALADAFGRELLDAENSLAAMMLAHWVDFADLRADTLADLAAIASLYGLAPRDDETIEGFRAHLKRYVRTFIEGPSTVRGILRVTAEALGIVIADEALDTWWDRAGGQDLTTAEIAGDDAATALFGQAAVLVRGEDAAPASFLGRVDLSRPVDLRGRSALSVSIDGAAPLTTDLATLIDPAAADLGALVQAIGGIPGLAAEAQGTRLRVSTRSRGAGARLMLADGPGDAAPVLLGIESHDYRGADSKRARITGTADLSAPSDLTTTRFLRLSVGQAAYEIDCAGADPAATTLAEIIAAIAAEAGPGVAAAEAGRLVLTAPEPGLAAAIVLGTAAAGDARMLLLGGAPAYARGADAVAARVTGRTDLSAGVDLSARSSLTVAIDARAPVTIDCAGPDPARTLAGDIAAAINTALGQPIATQNGAAITLTSLVTGAAGRIRFPSPPAGDAVDLILGLGTRAASGAASIAAVLSGTVDLSAGIDLSATARVQVAIDDATPVVADLASAGLARAGVSPDEVAAALNAATSTASASVSGGRLRLVSQAPGAAGSVALLPIETVSTRRFVSRAFSADEASKRVLGAFAMEAQGSAATACRLVGTVDLHDGLDVRSARYLRLALDGGPVIALDCAAAPARARALMLADLTGAINGQLGHPIASITGGRLALVSATTGGTSAVAVLPGGGDAAASIFGDVPRAAAGAAGTRVNFAGLGDLSARVDLSAANRLRIGIDGAAPVEILCAGGEPGATSAAEIAGRINAGLGGAYASTDGKAVRIASALSGNASEITVLAPSQDDATRLILGINAGRTYRGADAVPAILVTAEVLPASLDLRASPFIRLATDGGAGVLIDCRGADPGATTPGEIAGRINDAFAAPKPCAAFLDGGRLMIVAASAGPASRLALQAAGDFDAAAFLLGDAVAHPGADAAPARIVGSVDLRQPVDLSQRSLLRIALDGGRPVDIDVAGPAPDATFGDDIAAALNAFSPSLASLDASGHLVLVSPGTGPESGLAVLPLRPIELIDYVAEAVSAPPFIVPAGGRFSLDNAGASAAQVAFALSAPGGFCGADLFNLTTGSRVHVDAVAPPGATLTIAAGAGGAIRATLDDAQGDAVVLPESCVQATPSVLIAVVPFAGIRPLAANAPGTRPALALIDNLAGNCVVLEARGGASPGIGVASADPACASADPAAAPAGALDLAGRLVVQGRLAVLENAVGASIARLRAGAGVAFAAFDGLMVAVRGTWHPAGQDSLLVVRGIARLFDVRIGTACLAGVAIDSNAGAHSLTSRLAGAAATWVIARQAMPADALALPPRRSDWAVLSCEAARYDGADFNVGRFAGGACNEIGVFDLSRFDTTAMQDSPNDTHPRFAPFGAAPAMRVSASWRSHGLGRFTVNLPADLPAIFGGHFNTARFATAGGTSEAYRGVAFDPPGDPGLLTAILPQGASPSPLIYAKTVTTVPLGWEVQAVPFRQPREQFLSGGRADRPAAIYLREPGVPGFIGLFAQRDGAWGDEIGISLRYAGPALFDLTVRYAGARFECARRIVHAGRLLAEGESALPALASDILKPAPAGVVRAKAAGIAASVTRERT